MTRGSTAQAVCAAVIAIGLVGCGGAATDDPKPAATTSKAAPKKAALPKPALALVDDEESADAGKPIVVSVLDNDSVKTGGTPESLEVALDAGEFTLTVDTPPSHGTAEVDGSTVVYTSTDGYGGEDRFTYRIEVAGSAPLNGTAVVRITVEAPKPTPKPTPPPVKTKKPAPPPKPSVAYANCDAVRAAGAAPIHRGEPGYGPHLDRDGDGVGCEPYSGGNGGTGGTTGGGGSGSTYYKNCDAVRAAGAAPIHTGEPGYGRHLDRDGDGVGCE